MKRRYHILNSDNSGWNPPIEADSAGHALSLFFDRFPNASRSQVRIVRVETTGEIIAFELKNTRYVELQRWPGS